MIFCLAFFFPLHSLYFSLQNLFCSFLWFLFVKLLILSVYCFDFIELSLCVFLQLAELLKTAILNSLPSKSQISVSSSLVTGNHCQYLVVSYFSWFFRFLKVSCCYLHMLNSKSPPVFIDWLQKRHVFHQLCWDLRLSWIYGYTCFTLLSPSCGRIPKFVCSLLILQCISPVRLFCFPNYIAKS